MRDYLEALLSPTYQDFLSLGAVAVFVLVAFAWLEGFYG